MATVTEVEATIATLVTRLAVINQSNRTSLPSVRLIEATCPDLDATWHALWHDQELGQVVRGSADRRPDIRVKVDSDDLLALADGSLPFRRAWQAGRVRLDASVTDMLRLRTAL